MPFSVFPKFRATSAVLSSKIDAVIREMAALLNGGLSAANLKPGETFAASAFAEPRSLYTLQCNMIRAVDDDCWIGVVPIASRVIAAGLVGEDNDEFRLRVHNADGTFRANVADVATDRNLGNGTWAGHVVLSPAVDVAAGEILYFRFDSTGERGELTVFLDAPHQG
jgi:hypothetical protein